MFASIAALARVVTVAFDAVVIGAFFVGDLSLLLLLPVIAALRSTLC